MPILADHEYRIELQEGDPLADQPERIQLPLKPHQRAALHKAIVMERTGCVHFHEPNPEDHLRSLYSNHRATLRGRFRVRSNIGVLGDVVGYGKTLTALSIIASTPCQDIHRIQEQVISVPSYSYSHFIAHTESHEPAHVHRFISTTLVIVPRGPVFVQWERAIREQTGLRALVIDAIGSIRKLPGASAGFDRIKEEFEAYDLVLVKSTSFKTLMDHYTVPFHDHPIVAFDRIMIDEAHEILPKVPLLNFRFLWLISATYRMILHRTSTSRTMMPAVTRTILADEERLNLLLVMGKKSFVLQSFSVPAPVERYYLCHLPRHLAIVQPFLSGPVLERINANDIAGAIREMGGSNETESDVVQLVTRDIERDIRNQQRSIAFVMAQEIPEELRQARLATMQAELARLEDKLANLRERVSQLSEKTCPICMDNYDNPIMLPCTHVFCGQCLLTWMRSGQHNGQGRACPQCRTRIQSDRMVAIVAQRPDRRAEPTEPIASKEDTLLRIIQNKPSGRFLVFSRLDATFYTLASRLTEAGVSLAEMKGSTAMMMKTLERFQAGQARVLLLNSYHTGSGIDLSMATDVVIFHDMGLQREQCIGRGQRVGRTQPLTIHNLCYPHEMQDGQSAAAAPVPAAPVPVPVPMPPIVPPLALPLPPMPIYDPMEPMEPMDPMDAVPTPAPGTPEPFFP